MKQINIVFLGRKVGVTLTEVLIVVVILGILATLALPMFVKTIEKAKVGEAMSNLNLIRTGQKIYFLEQSNFSGNITSLNIEDPNSEGSRYFSYEITTEYNSDDFTARATRGGEGAQSAPAPYDTYYYDISKDGRITSNG